MAMLPGRCVNVMYCTTAAEGEIVRVPAEGRFACPQCSKALVPPNMPLHRRAQGRIGRTIDKPASIVIGGGSFMCGILLGMIMFNGGLARIMAAVSPGQTLTSQAQAAPVPAPSAALPAKSVQAPAPAETQDSDTAPFKPATHHTGRHARHKS